MSNAPIHPPPDLIEGAIQAAEAMRDCRVSYALIGGLAAGKRTNPRFTRDVDFLLNVPQITLPSLLENLARRGFDFDMSVTIREWTQHHMTTMSFRGVRFDWLKPVIPLYQHVLDK